MSDNDPISYSALVKGTPVLDAQGNRVGTVEHVLDDPELDLFDGIVIATDNGLRFVDANQAKTITVGSVHTTLSADAAARLPEPDGDPVYEADGLQDVGQSLTARLGRLFRREHWTLKD